jgi:hypothetical protein
LIKRFIVRSDDLELALWQSRRAVSRHTREQSHDCKLPACWVNPMDRWLPAGPAPWVGQCPCCDRVFRPRSLDPVMAVKVRDSEHFQSSSCTYDAIDRNHTRLASASGRTGMLLQGSVVHLVDIFVGECMCVHHVHMHCCMINNARCFHTLAHPWYRRPFPTTSRTRARVDAQRTERLLWPRLHGRGALRAPLVSRTVLRHGIT